MITLQDLFEYNQIKLDLKYVVEGDGSIPLFPPGEHFIPGPELVGFLNLIHPNRIHILAHKEIAYFEHLDAHRRSAINKELAGSRAPALFITDGITPSSDITELCQKEHLPLITTPHSAAHVIDTLRMYFSKAQAKRTTMHGVLMDVLGLGVLITGESGLGKSELALELISRGHGLVADDVVDLARVASTIIEGRCPPLLTNMLEVRGLGLLDIKAIFGETAVRRKMRLKLIVHLVKRSTMESDYERLPIDSLTEEVLGLPVQKVVVPVDLGRNIAVLLEAAVRNTILKLRGIHTMQDFINRQSSLIESDNNREPGH